MKMSLEQMFIEDYSLLRDGMDALASTSSADLVERLVIYPAIFFRL